MLILTIILCVILGWELRNILSALIQQERKRHCQELRLQKLRQDQTWAQIKRVGPKPKEVICK